MAASTYTRAYGQQAPFYTPPQVLSTGTVKYLTEDPPTIFRPLRIRGIELRNRICVSPMCQYSCAASAPLTGALTPLYLATIGHYAYKGAALVMLEATGVQPNGRISTKCPGLYNDTQTEAIRTVADFVHSQGGLIGVQLSHGGRKSSTLAPWIANSRGQASAKATHLEGSWLADVIGTSDGRAHTWDGKSKDDPTGEYHEPREISNEDIIQLIQSFANSAKRAVKAGLDIIKIHAAHGYLIHQFLSPSTNHRSDNYGGSFENRIRLLLEVIKSVRAAIPTTMPLFVRISATDWMEGTEIADQLGSWDLESTTKLVHLLPSLGVDLVDISSAEYQDCQSYCL